MFWHPILLERYSLLDHCGSLRKTAICPSTQSASISHSFSVYLYTHSHPFNNHYSTHLVNTHLSIHLTPIHPFNIHSSTHSISMHPPPHSTPVYPTLNIHLTIHQSPCYAPKSSPKPIHLIFIYLLIIHHSMYTYTSIHAASNINLSHSSIQHPSTDTPIPPSTHEDIQWASTEHLFHDRP